MGQGRTYRRIATGKMHVQDPVGVEQLTSYRHLVNARVTLRSERN